MAVLRMDHVGIVVEDLEGAVAFFVALGLEVENERPQPIEGAWVDRVVGIDGVRTDIVMLRTPDGHGRLELTRFRSPRAVPAASGTPNALGLRNVMFAVDDIDASVARLAAVGAGLMGGIARYEELYRLCYVRGPEGIIVALAEQVG